MGVHGRTLPRRVDRPRKVVGRGYCEVGLQISREAREVALDSRLEILIHHRLVSLVLGLNSHVYSLWVAVTQRSCRRRHGIQKESRVFNEELRVLVLRAVIGVGVDDQLRIRDVLLHDEGVDRGHDHVIAAVHDERRLLDRLQIVVGPLSLDAPLVHRFDLGGRHLVVHFGIAPLLPKMRALQELPSRRLACLGRTELDREPDIIGRIVGGAEEPPRSLGQRLHTLTTARTGT